MRALREGSLRAHALAGLAFGLAQAAKFTAAFLVPIHALVALGWCLSARSLRPLVGAPAFLLLAWLGLNGAYAFQGSDHYWTGTVRKDPVEKDAIVVAAFTGLLDLSLVRDLLPRTVVLDGGRVVADGPSEQLLVDGDLLSEHGLEPLSDHAHPTTGTTRHPEDAPNPN